MTTPGFHFSLNRMSAPRLPFGQYVSLCQRLDIRTIEIRNDLDGVEMRDGTPAAELRAAAEEADLTILTINALPRFEQWNAEREREAIELADFAADCGARALVLCPTNSPDDKRSAGDRHADLVTALQVLAPILSERRLIGLIEPLGFDGCALRRKSDAVKGIYAAAGERVFKLLHDTFHHHRSGEDIFYPDLTGLVHISGVEHDLPVARMDDSHRVLVGAADRLGNVRQLKTLLQRGYRGAFSFEPFAAELAEADDIEDRLRTSMDFVRAGVA
jgi:2-keto-myo-inositol isomerase